MPFLYILFCSIIFNHLTNLVGSQCVLASNVHTDLRQLSYRSVIGKSYGRYDIDGFCFRSTIFEASHPLAATTNTEVVTRVIEEGHKTKYYRIIKNIIKYNFAGNKKLKTVFFECDWFDPNHGTRETNLAWLKSNMQID
jgi:hypothetical protein